MSSSPRHMTVARFGILSGAVLLTAVALSAGGCEHDQKVVDLSLPITPTGARIAPRYVEQGLDPKVALRPTYTVVETPAAPPADPVVLGTESCGNEPVRDEYVPTAEVAAEAQRLLGKMTTVEQRLIQLTGQDKPNYNDNNRWRDIQQSRDDYKLGIRGYQWRDGPHGINLEAGLENKECFGDGDCVDEAFRKTKFGSGDHPTQGNYSTSFPTSVSQGATFDIELMEKLGEAMGDETIASGHNVLLTPCMNLLRNPLWGRAQETFGEDVFHLGRSAAAHVWGLQQHVTGCVKHYMANNIELRRMYINATMSERALREVYGRHFEMVVREGGIGCVMASYNLVNGKKATQNTHLLTQVLKRDFGFRGFVLTDWWAMPATDDGQGNQNTVSDSTRVAIQAIYAGLDVEVPWAVNFYTLADQVENGTVPWGILDQAVLRVLEQKLRFGTAMLGSPWGPHPELVNTGYDPARGSITNTEAAGHTELATKAAEEGMVLLKNEGGVLPIPQGITKVALIGPKIDFYVNSDSPKHKVFDFTENVALGDRGSSRVRPDPALVKGPREGLQMAREGVEIVVGHSADDIPADAGFVVVVVGLTAGDEGEEYTGAADRSELTLPPHWDWHDSAELKSAWQAAKQGDQEKVRPKTLDQNKLIMEAHAKGIPMVVVIESGGVVDDSEAYPWLDTVPAIVQAWYSGQRGGEALGRLLMGNSNFAGRLPVTWPFSLDQFPTFTRGDQVPNEMEYNVGYRHFDALGHVPRFYFGHGLSYSTFSIDRIHTPCGAVTSNALVQLEVDVTNRGPYAGDEVILVFASYQASGVMRSKKELKGFARVNLQNGESKRVTIPIRIEDMRFWDEANNEWVIEGGPLDLWVGTSSAPDKLVHHTTVTVERGSFK